MINENIIEKRCRAYCKLLGEDPDQSVQAPVTFGMTPPEVFETYHNRIPDLNLLAPKWIGYRPIFI